MSVLNVVAHTHKFKDQKPEQDMGATCFLLNDRNPYTVVKVINDKECVVQADSVYPDPTKFCEMGHQNWVIERNPDADLTHLTLRKDGKWREKGIQSKDAGRFWLLGQRDHYYCWEF